MNNIDIFAMQPDDPRFCQVEDLFRELYIQEEQLGESIPLVKNGEHLWGKTLNRMLGKTTSIIVAVDLSTSLVVGFIWGTLKMTPSYFGGERYGLWECYSVKKDYQRQGIATKMISQLFDWFRSKKIHLVEVERVITNDNSITIFNRFEMKEEIVKYRVKI